MIKIGIPAQNQPDNKFGVNINYLGWIEQFGHPVTINPIHMKDFLDVYGHLDAFVIPGGQDINPSRYGEKGGYYTQPSNPFLEYFDVNIIPLIHGKYPIFGICRGLQSLNVFYGGTLHQHIWNHPTSQYENDLAHDVIIGKNNKGGDLLYKVNSFHHQAIKQLGAGLKVEAKTKFGLFEAISNIASKVFAVQWHPERMEEDSFSIDAFRKILG